MTDYLYAALQQVEKTPGRTDFRERLYQKNDGLLSCSINTEEEDDGQHQPTTSIMHIAVREIRKGLETRQTIPTSIDRSMDH